MPGIEINIDLVAEEVGQYILHAELVLDSNSQLTHAMSALEAIGSARALCRMALASLQGKRMDAEEDRFTANLRNCRRIRDSFYKKFQVAYLVPVDKDKPPVVAHVQPVAAQPAPLRQVGTVATKKARGGPSKLNAQQKTRLIALLNGGKPNGSSSTEWYRLLGQEFGIDWSTVAYYMRYVERE